MLICELKTAIVRDPWSLYIVPNDGSARSIIKDAKILNHKKGLLLQPKNILKPLKICFWLKTYRLHDVNLVWR